MFTCFECPRVASEYDYYRCYLIIYLYQTKKRFVGYFISFSSVKTVNSLKCFFVCVHWKNLSWVIFKCVWNMFLTSLVHLCLAGSKSSLAIYTCNVLGLLKCGVTVVCAGSLYCNATFDNWLCWDFTPAGQSAFQRCPYDFIEGFNRDGRLLLWSASAPSTLCTLFHSFKIAKFVSM